MKHMANESELEKYIKDFEKNLEAMVIERDVKLSLGELGALISLRGFCREIEQIDRSLTSVFGRHEKR